MIGIVLKDWTIRKRMRQAARETTGDDIFLVGDTRNMIRCLNILDDDELRKFLEAI